MTSLSALWAMLPACRARRMGSCESCSPSMENTKSAVWSRSTPFHTLSHDVKERRKRSVFIIPLISYGGTTFFPFVQAKTEIFVHFFPTFSYLFGGENVGGTGVKGVGPSMLPPICFSPAASWRNLWDNKLRDKHFLKKRQIIWRKRKKTLTLYHNN